MRAIARLGRHRHNLTPSGDDRRRPSAVHAAVALCGRCGVAATGAVLSQRLVLAVLGSSRLLRPLAFPLAAVAASVWAALVPAGALREGCSLVMLSRALMVAGNWLVRAGKVPASRYHSVVIFTLSCFEIMKAG